METFADFLNHVIGTRTILLSYVIHEDATFVPNNAHTLVINQPYWAEFGSIEGDLIALASHLHALFHNYNSKVYYYLEEAVMSNGPVMPSISSIEVRISN